MDNPVDIFIRDFGQSLSSWMNYIFSVKRGPILQESAIRYAVSEFLEVNKHSAKTEPIIESYSFEQNHPFYKSLRTDLYFKAKIFNRIADESQSSLIFGDPKELSQKCRRSSHRFFMEFKYVNEETDSKESLFFDYMRDICRQSCIKKNLGANTHCYFAVVGEQTLFINNFMVISEGADIPSSLLPTGKFAEVLTFDINSFKGKQNLADIKKDKDIQCLDLSSDKMCELSKNIEFSNIKTESIVEDNNEINNSVGEDKKPQKQGPFHFVKKTQELTKKALKDIGLTLDFDTIKYVQPKEKIYTRLVYSNFSIQQSDNKECPTSIESGNSNKSFICIWEILN